LSYSGFVSRVQILPTAATQKTYKALPVRCSGEAPPGARGIGKLCDDHYKVGHVAIGHHPPRGFAVYVLHA